MSSSSIKGALLIVRTLLLLTIVSAIAANSVSKSDNKDSRSEKIIIEQVADAPGSSVLNKVNPAVSPGLKYNYYIPHDPKPVYYHHLTTGRFETYRFPAWSRSTFT